MRELTQKQQMFCINYMAYLEFNGTKAAIMTGYKKSNARFQASRLLAKPKVKEYIREIQRRNRLGLGLPPVVYYRNGRKNLEYDANKSQHY